MNTILKLSGAYPHSDLDALCREIERVRKERAPNGLRLDFRDLTGLQPTTLAVLLASIAGLHDDLLHDPLKRLIPPINPDGVACLQEEVLKRLIRDEVGHWQKRLDGTGSIIGSEAFSDQDSIHRMLKNVAGHMHSQGHLPATSNAAVYALTYELAANVLRHSESNRGIAIIEFNPARHQLTLAIADTGIGIRASLAHNPDLAQTDDLSAIVTAMGAATTGEPGTGAGMGLYLAHKVIQDNGGTILVRSGKACRKLSPAVKNSTGLANLQGTLVAVKIRTDKSLDYGRVDQELSEPAGISDPSSD
jgi:anti-sigma regulatory factor (Ser/Thr protein kinase)